MPEPIIAAQPIGVLGGTFDPVHIGHLRLAIEACELLRLACVRMIPLNQPNHRGPPVVSAERRLQMLNRVSDGKNIVIDDREIVRGGTSYMVDTLESLRSEFPTPGFCLLLGEDAFAGLCGWHQWETLFKLCHIVVVTRPDVQVTFEPRLKEKVAALSMTDADILHQETHGRIFFQPIPMLPISSTDIRARIASGRNVRHLLPESVISLIEQHRLYQNL